MKALICSTPGTLVYDEVDKPVMQPKEALLRIRRIGICGTDLHAYEGTQPFFNYPRILGHELAAEFVESNDPELTGFSEGDAVTFAPYLYCGHCVACRAGKTNCCVAIRVCGVHVDGGMVEYFSVPTYSLVHGNGLGFDELALIEPLSIGSHAISRAAVLPGETVLVIGAGPIGIGIMEFARIAGATVIAMDINEKRLQFCKDKLQVHHTVKASEADAANQVRDITGGDWPQVVIDATGNIHAINTAFSYLAHGGRYVLVGLQKGDISFSHPEFHKREATLMSSRNATQQDFAFVIRCIRDGLINPTHYITHRTRFDQIKREFDSWLNPASGVIKAMVEM